MAKSVVSRNRRFMNHCRLLNIGRCQMTNELKEGHTQRLSKVTPYMHKMKDSDKEIVFNETLNNPWYTLRELVRIQVGTTKRFITLSRGELLALMNAHKGGRTFVSAPHGTCNTNLLVLLALMRKPKVVIYTTCGSPFQNNIFEKEFLERYDGYVNLMPKYLRSIFQLHRPHLVPYNQIERVSNEAGVITVPGYNIKDILIVSDNYELGNIPLGVKRLEDIELLRKFNGYAIPWLLTSPMSDLSVLNSIRKGIVDATPDNVHLGEDRFVSISLKDIPRFRSDRSKVKYYQEMIFKYNLEQIFEPRS